MDFSKTRVCQRTRSCYQKLYKEFNKKKKAERLSSSGGGGGGDCRLNRESGGRSVEARAGGVVCTVESSGKSSEGSRESDGRGDDVDSRSRKIRKGGKGKEELGKVLKRSKNVSEIGPIDESEGTDDDDVGNHSKFGIKEAFESGKVEKKLQRRNFLKIGKNVSQNSLIDESEDDDVLKLGKSPGRNLSKFDVQGVSGSGKIKKKFENGSPVLNRVSLGGKGGFVEKLKNHKSIGTNDSQKNTDDDDDALSCLGSGNIEKKPEKGFVNNTTASKGDCLKERRRSGENLERDTSVSSHGGFLGDSDDDDGVTYLGDNVTCLDDRAPSHSSRVESNEVKVSAVELESNRADDGDHDPQELKSPEEDDEDCIVISSSFSDHEDSEEDEIAMKDGNDDDFNVLEMENNDGSRTGLTEVEKGTSDVGDKDKEEHGNIDEKENDIEPGVIKKRCWDWDVGDMAEAIEAGLKKRRKDDTDALRYRGNEVNEGCQSTAAHLPSQFHPVCKSEKKQLKQESIDGPDWVEDYSKLDFLPKDDNDGGGVRNFMLMVEEKGTQKAWYGCKLKKKQLIQENIHMPDWVEDFSKYAVSPEDDNDRGDVKNFVRVVEEKGTQEAGNGCKLKKKQLIQESKHGPDWVEDYSKLDFAPKDDNEGGGVKNLARVVEEKGTQKAGKSTGIQYDRLGSKIDVIKILSESIREEDDGDNLLKKYVTSLEDTLSEEPLPEETLLEETSIERVLPNKFRFEDEDDMEPVNVESEMEVNGLFNEMNMCLQLSEIGSSGIRVVGRNVADFLVGDTDQATRCRNGKHRLTINDEFGIICRCCSYVEMEIRHMLPPLSKNEKGGHEKYDYDKAVNPNFSNLQWDDCHPDSRKSKYEKGTVWDLVPGVRETMYLHQREGFEFIWEKIAGGTYIEKLEKGLPNGGSGCIISHAPGTGKSRLTIVFLQAFMRMYPDSRPLIIAPRCMLLTWEEEFEKWKVDLPFYNLNSNDINGQEDRTAAALLRKSRNGKSSHAIRLLKLRSWKKKSSILGITYRLFESLAGEEGKRKRKQNNPQDEGIKKMLLQVPTLLVLDEGHTPRNEESLMWKALLNVKTKRSIILSGTPFQNNFDELYNTLCLVNPLLLFDNFSTKRGRKNNTTRGHWDSLTSSVRKSKHKLDELKAMIDPYVHVHKGTILQERLLGLRDALVVLKPTKMQQMLLDKMRGSRLSIGNDNLMSLISVHPSLLPKRLSEQQGLRRVLKMYKKDARAGVKTNFVLELINLSDALDEKVLVFSQYIKPLKLIMQLLKTNYEWIEGREFLYMDGKQEEKHRQSSINTLNNPKSEVKVLLASMRACSEGINLVGASRVVLLDVHWNPSVERQAISRAYRLGQKKLVHVYHLVTGDMEGEKFVRQVEKSHLSELVFSSKNRDSLNPKILSTVSSDKILEEMVQHERLQDMFEKVIYQPKESDLIHSFDLYGAV